MVINRLAVVFFLLAGCSKKESEEPVNCPDEPVMASIVSSQPCTGTGNISITSPVGAGMMYKIGNGPYAFSPLFPFLLPGSYLVTVKTANGCEYESTSTVPALPSGPLYGAVKLLLISNCTSCHSGTNPQAGLDWTKDCDILNYWDRIKARAVDGNPSPMPQAGLMPLQERNIIMNWINAGHRYAD